MTEYPGFDLYQALLHGPVEPQFIGPMQPVYPCREMATRHCPAMYGTVCGERLCARFESEDDQSMWLPEVAAFSDKMGGTTVSDCTRMLENVIGLVEDHSHIVALGDIRATDMSAEVTISAPCTEEKYVVSVRKALQDG